MKQSTSPALVPDWRRALPERILMCLPFTLFFPVGIMYAGILLFYIGLVISGDWRTKLDNVRSTPLLVPILILSTVSVVIGLTTDKVPETAQEFWPGFAHYQTYILLLPFLSLGYGDWQRKAVKIFFGSAVVASTLFVANALHLLPDNTLFRSYVLYQGNKSILLGMLLAIAAGWMLHELRLRQDHRWLRIAVLFYVVAALILLSKTRTASLMFFLMCGLMLMQNFNWSWRSLALPLLLVVSLYGGCKYATNLPPPATCSINDAHVAPWEVIKIRAVCTIQQVRDFSEGRKIDDDGMRLEIYKITFGMIAEQPWTGHGIASWMPNYQKRSQGLSSNTMTTPHNDYLLYATELGVAGLFALIGIWIMQLRIAYRMSKSAEISIRNRAMLLAMLTSAMMLGGMFNAILRDGVFGMAFMILLAIPLAGVRRSS
ncbi:O-antigen ligase family protein [Undibacterium jejuense]|nr:O-antigen ligase family protein [Undibacterium jejuense]